MEENINIENRQTEQVEPVLETCSNQGDTKPLPAPKKWRGRPFGSFKYEVAGKKVSVFEYKAWQAKNKRDNEVKA